MLGCFHCLGIFPPSEIIESTEEPENRQRGAGKTAMYPNCDIDAVLPESECYEITTELHENMNRFNMVSSSALNNRRLL
jgi:hypothetical protein